MSQDNRIFLYVNFYDEDESIGITKKIHSQIDALKRLGYKVTYTSYIDNGVAIKNESGIIYNFCLPKVSKQIFSYIKRFLLLHCVNKFLRTTHERYKFAYLRWHTYDMPFLQMLKALKDQGAVNIVEAHAYTPNLIPTSIMSRYQIYMDDKHYDEIHCYVDYVVAISEYDNIWGVDTIHIDNAVDCNLIRPRDYKRDDSKIRLLCVANERNYHGVDRLLKGMHTYNGNNSCRKVTLCLVGEYMNSTVNLVKSLNLEGIVTFTGKLSGERLDMVYDNSDIGIGALAHHRIGMYSGSSLKTKEYFAKGLPFIYGWREPAFDDSYPYALRVPLDETPISIDEIVSFFDRIKNEDYLNEMREFALDNYSWDREFERVFDYIER